MQPSVKKLESIAKRFGTPCYVYRSRKIHIQCKALKLAFAGSDTELCFAVKANSTQGILKRIFAQGYGADIVSGGELQRALMAGAKPSQILFSGVGKQDWEIELALRKGILAFNAESPEELERTNGIAKALRKTASVLLRCNPNINARTNPYIATGSYSSKFGISEDQFVEAVRLARSLKSLRLIGVGCHLGSQITDLRVFQIGADRMATLASDLRQGHPEFSWLDLGGGMAVRYQKEIPVALDDYAETVLAAASRTGLRLILEPGRFLVAESGSLLTRVIGLKSTPEKTFVVVDAAMNDLIRPSLYHAVHPIEPVRPRPGHPIKVDVVGPICETADWLALDRNLPPLVAGDLLVIGVCGAYGSTMASNYNSRPRAPEILVEGTKTLLLKRREPLRQLWSGETRISRDSETPHRLSLQLFNALAISVTKLSSRIFRRMSFRMSP